MEQPITEVHERADDTVTENEKQDSYFPYAAQSEHWNADFANSKEVYEGSALPLWILAGWAVFIIWAIAYLTIGVRTTF